MAGLTSFFGFRNALGVDDYVIDSDNDVMADALDRIVGNIILELLGNCVVSGWTLNADKTVALGTGFVESCRCVTTGDQAITSLTNGSLNYVFAKADGTSPEDGTVVFYASTSSTKAAGHILLGTMTLDGAGVVTARSNTPNGNDRGHFALKARTFSGSGALSALAGGASVEVTVDHTAQGLFHVPGALSIVTGYSDVSYETSDDDKEEEFKVTFENTGSYSRDVSYTWQRKGLAA